MAEHSHMSIGKLESYLKEIEPLKKGFDVLTDHVVITDPNANIIYANKAVEANTGFGLGEVIGHNPADLWGGHMAPEFYKNMWQTIKVEKKPFVGEVTNKRKDGSEYWQELHISPILDAAGEIKFFIAIEPNITDRKQKEQFREEFISIIGHQLKNPIAAIGWTLDLFNLGMLSKEGQMTDEQKQALQTLYEQNRNLSDLIGDLLTLSRVERNKISKESFDVSAQIAEIIYAAKKQHPGVDFSFSKPAEPVNVTADKTLSRQILNNLIFNAAEYSDQKSGKVAVSLEKSGRLVKFSCRDNGIGIAEADRPKIFSRFFRTDNAQKFKTSGTGLGLFIAKLIADSLNWKIYFESELGKGTTFFVDITDGV